MDFEQYYIYAADHLIEAVNKTSNRIINALFLTNGGGTITILTYIYNKQLTFNFSQFHTGALVFFIVGLLFAFILVVIEYLLTRYKLHKFTTWSKNKTNAKSNEDQNQNNLKELSELLSKNTGCHDLLLIIIGALSGIFFILGVIFSIISVFK